MMEALHPRLLPLAARTHPGIAPLRQGWERLRRGRALAVALAHLDDRLLRDIGLERWSVPGLGDVVRPVVAEPEPAAHRAANANRPPSAARERQAA